MTGGCATVTRGGALPPPYQRCASPGRVSYGNGGDPNPEGVSSADSPEGRGLVYAPGLTDPGKVLRPDICVRHLGVPWWAFMGMDNALRPCATSFQFVGAP